MINELFYIDFEPAAVEKSFWKGATYEPTEAVMVRVNEWIRKNYSRDIINVETIVITRNSYDKGNTNITKLQTGGGFIYMIQAIRVWYK